LLCSPFLRSFLTQRNLREADGRPIYAYRCSAKEMDLARDAIRSDIEEFSLSRASRIQGQVFCLFAAEWWRNHHEGGSWKWEEILEECGLRGAPHSAIYPLVKGGLNQWKRKLLQDHRGRIFLVTLACEGGLPLRLVRKEGAALHEYFRNLLEAVQAFQGSGLSAAQLAEERSFLLPKSLRQTVVFELGGQLAEAIWDLQESAGDGPDPIGALDSSFPSWRLRLPLELHDDTARALFRRLVVEAGAIRRRQPPRFRAVRRLTERTPRTWTLSMELESPDLIHADQLACHFGVPTLPSRLHLLIQVGRGTRRFFALATEIKTPAGKAFRIEHTGRSKLSFEGEEAAAPVVLWAELPGTTLGPFTFAGFTELGELPWVATEAENRAWRIVGQGSVRVQDSECLVALPAEMEGAVPGDSTESLGLIECLGRAARRLSGTLQMALEGGPCVIRTMAKEAAAFDFVLSGPTLDVAMRERVFCGRPKICALPRDFGGNHRVVAESDVEWRSRCGIRDWRPYGEECLGEVSLRVRKGDELVYQAFASIVPASFGVELRPSRRHTAGSILFQGLAGAMVSVTPVDGLTARLTAPERIELECAGEPPAGIETKLHWGGDRVLRLELAFPAHGARFLDAEAVLPIDHLVALSHLPGIRAVGLTVDSQERFFIEGTLIAQDLPETSDYRVWVDIPRSMHGTHELDLRFLQEPLRLLFAETEDLDAVVRLRLDSKNGTNLRPRPLHVARFGLSFRLEKGKDWLGLESRLGDWEEPGEIWCEALRIWDPGVPGEVLPHDGPGWHFDTRNRDPGPWLLIGWLGTESVVRPTCWTVSSNDSGAGSNSPLDLVQETVLISNARERSRSFREVFAHLSENPLSEDWRSLDQMLERLAALPVSSIQAAKELVVVPRAAVVALLRASTANAFETLWRVLLDLPFLWCLVSLKDWLAASKSYAEAIQSQVKLVPGLEHVEAAAFHTLFTQGSDVEHRAFLRPIFQIVKQRLFGERQGDGELASSESDLGRQQLKLALKAEMQSLFHRSEELTWPRIPAVDQWRRQLKKDDPRMQVAIDLVEAVSEYRRSVLTAPLMAAWAVTRSASYPRHWVHYVRTLRSYDEEWFDRSLPLLIYLLLDRTHFETGEADVRS
jgi:hypothetical protein